MKGPVGDPPPRSRKKVQHSTATMQLARTMYAGGWTPTQIRRYLVNLMEGGAPSLSTVRTWVVPGLAEERLQWKREYQRRYRAEGRPSRTPLLDRMRQLQEAGATQASIAAAIGLYEGVPLTEGQVRYYLRHGREPRIPKRRAG